MAPIRKKRVSRRVTAEEFQKKLVKRVKQKKRIKRTARVYHGCEILYDRLRAGFPESIEILREHGFAENLECARLWRFDICFPQFKIAIEYDGGTLKGGRHNREPGYSEDCLKINTATANGWRVFRFTRPMIEPDDGDVAMNIIGLAIQGRCGRLVDQNFDFLNNIALKNVVHSTQEQNKDESD